MPKRHQRQRQPAHGQRHQRQRQPQVTRQQVSGKRGADKVGDAKAQQDQRDALNARLADGFKERTQVGEEGKMAAENQDRCQHPPYHSRTTQHAKQRNQAAAALRFH